MRIKEKTFWYVGLLTLSLVALYFLFLHTFLIDRIGIQISHQLEAANIIHLIKIQSLTNSRGPEVIDIEVETNKEQAALITPELISKAFTNLSQEDFESIFKKNRILLKIFVGQKMQGEAIELLPFIFQNLKLLEEPQMVEESKFLLVGSWHGSNLRYEWTTTRNPDSSFIKEANSKEPDKIPITVRGRWDNSALYYLECDDSSEFKFCTVFKIHSLSSEESVMTDIRSTEIFKMTKIFD